MQRKVNELEDALKEKEERIQGYQTKTNINCNEKANILKQSDRMTHQSK
jgi:hypothetical protein